MLFRRNESTFHSMDLLGQNTKHDVTMTESMTKAPCEHDVLEHQTDGVCFIGLVLTPAHAGRCELSPPSCGASKALGNHT